MAETTVRLPQFGRDAQVRAESFDAEANTIEIVWTTGASVRRYDWWDGTEYDEVLSLDKGAVRLERLNAGAPFLDTHCSYGLDNVIGSVVPNTAKIEGGRGTATVLLSKAPGVADTVQKIREGVIRNISVGYWVHKIVKTEGDDGTVARWDVVDWEPLEISAVPIPADAGSQIRSEQQDEAGKGPALRSCVLVTSTRSPARGPKQKARKEISMAKRNTTAPAKRNATRTAKTPAEIEAERLAKGRNAKRNDEDKDVKEEAENDDERDEDEERDGDEGKKGDGEGSDDERDADDDDGDEEDEAETGDDKRSASKTAAKREAESAVRVERSRIAKITEMAERAGLPKLGRKHVTEGTSVKRFGDLVLERMLAKQEKRGNGTFSANSDEDVSRSRGGSVAGREQRDMADGEAHWRKVAGKPVKAA